MCHETLRQRTGRRESRRSHSLFPTARYQTSWKMIWRSRSCQSTYTGVRPSFWQLRAPELQATCTTDHTAGDGAGFGCQAVPFPAHLSPLPAKT